MLSLLLALAATAAAQNCDCYVTDGNFPTYYRNHGFWDFRSLPNAVRTPDKIASLQGNLDADFTAPYFSWSGAFTQFWGPQNWPETSGPIDMANSYNNLYISTNENPSQSETYLTMRTYREADFQSVAEFESIEEVDHASMRMYARTRGAPGACTAMFTFDLATEQESDIEVLTADPKTAIQYTNQPVFDDEGEWIPEASHNITMPGGTQWDRWAEHRLDWTPGRTTWLVNGQQTHTMTFQAPVLPAQVVFNAWSNGDSGWTGEMEVGREAFQHIQWIEMLYNVVDQGQCGNVCSIDQASAPGEVVRV